MASRKNIAWLAAYGAWIGALLIAMFQARAYTVEHLSGGERQAEWQQFQEDMRAESGLDGPVEGPVQHKVRRSNEPPQLVLLRDYFITCIAGTLLFGSALFAMMMVAVRGVMAK